MSGPPPIPPEMILVSSILSHRTREGLVQVQWGEKAAQMSVAQARQMGRQFLEAAEAAETDELVWRFFTELRDNSEGQETAIKMIMALRALRDKRFEERLAKGEDVQL